MLDPFLLRAVAAFGCSCAVSWVLTATLLRLAPYSGLIDQPGARKVHVRPIPRGGGLAIYAGLLAGLWTIGQVGSSPLPGMLAAGFGIVVLGLIDDIRDLPWQVRLAVQLIMTAGTVYALHGDRDWSYQLVAVFWIVGLINAFNMLDNMDALSAGVAWIAAGMLLVASGYRHGWHFSEEEEIPCLMLMGALLGFLWFNRPPARIFMGDAGSTFLGFFLGLRSLDLYPRDGLMRYWIPVACIFAVPCYDLCSVVVLRLWQRRSPFHADKQHLSHRLVALGLSPRCAVGVIYLLAVASGIGGLLIQRLPEESGGLVAVQVVCWWFAIGLVEYFRHYQNSATEK
jgi:UDP-GlcNAc:undecaprenyl-phosphate GlcNAc-1-phosphate transferase